MGQAPSVIADLIDRFERNQEAYKSQGYNETRLRVEFLDPFFKALGWDVHNELGHAEAYKDVIHEDAIRVGGVSKAPDYCFRIGGVRKFFLEAKNPSVNVKDDPHPAYQLRRYAWSAKLPLSILTDFEEFAVYDCRTRPSLSDKSTTGRVHYWTYNDYLAKWDDIAAIFSKDAILKGSFDKNAVSERRRGTATVDAEFLKEIEQWREALAKNLAVCNKKLAVHDLNFAVQRTIDRIIFLRICEDRSVEHYGQLQALLNGERTYPRLRQLFTQADDRYNSGLFHFQAEKDRAEAPDTITPSLKIDDKVLKDILKRLYYPDSPYEFSVFPLEILGQVYEQFLGKVIRLTAGHQAKVEEKPEVKKAGGVYYTPSYIVHYIVQQTVGVLCKDKTPKQIEKLRILDPACGSGSFLMGAYTWLLDYHRDWYIKDGPDKHKKELFRTAAGEHRLTTQEKKRILLNNIYGVDIDSQAVEVTKLSLLLKVLEGESDETLRRQLSFVKDRALPDLGKNIKCGNSLIGPDYFTGKMFPDEDEMRRVNPFDWKAEFPKIMKAGGIDAVIGNPPYGAYLFKEDKDYLSAKFTSQTYQLDSYLLFLEHSMSNLLGQGGHYGMIIPNPWLTNLLQTRIRRFVFEKTRVREIVHFRFPVFPKVTVDTEIVLLQNSHATDCEVVVRVAESLEAFLSRVESQGFRTIRHKQEKWQKLNGDTINIFSSQEEETLAQKCNSRSASLGSLCEINVGIKPYQVGKGTPPQTKAVVESRPFDSDRPKAKSFRSYLRGSDIKRFIIAPLEPRFLKYGPWLAEPRPAANFDAPVKIVMRQTGDSLMAALDRNQYLCLNNMHVLVPHASTPSSEFLVGVINSSLLNWYYQSLNPEAGEALAEVKKANVERLPIIVLDLQKNMDKKRQDQMVSLVERMLDLHKRLETTRNPNDKTRLQSQINSTDHEIDRLVYDLYGLTEDEIKIVEACGEPSRITTSVASSSKVEEITAMKQEPKQPTDPAQVNTRLQQWRSRNNTPSKVAAAHRKVLLERVSQSMAFENQPVSTDRLKTLTVTPKAKAS